MRLLRISALFFVANIQFPISNSNYIALRFLLLLLLVAVDAVVFVVVVAGKSNEKSILT